MPNITCPQCLQEIHIDSVAGSKYPNLFKIWEPDYDGDSILISKGYTTLDGDEGEDISVTVCSAQCVMDRVRAILPKMSMDKGK